MDVRDGSKKALQAFKASAERPGGSMPKALREVREDIATLVLEALSTDREMIPRLVNLIHLLLDCARDVISQDVASQALEEVEKRLTAREAEPLDAFILRGQEISFVGDWNGCTMIPWETFRDRFAPFYAKSRSPSDEQELRRLLKAGELKVPEVDLPLGREGGVVWFTDEDLLRERAPGAGSYRIDGNAAYDLLGLDWSGRWSKEPLDEGTWAVLISLPLSQRSGALSGIRVPTALEGWGSLVFVSRASACTGDWPSFAGLTVHPLTGEECLPEGVHGRIEVRSETHCPVTFCGGVLRLIPDRLDECGDAIARRALQRLAEY